MHLKHQLVIDRERYNQFSTVRGSRDHTSRKERVETAGEPPTLHWFSTIFDAIRDSHSTALLKQPVNYISRCVSVLQNREDMLLIYQHILTTAATAIYSIAGSEPSAADGILFIPIGIFSVTSPVIELQQVFDIYGWVTLW